MTEIILPRRKFLIGMASLLAAPAIVRIESLMQVRSSLQIITDYVPGELVNVDVLYGQINLITKEALKLFVNSNLFLNQFEIKIQNV